MSGQKKGVNCVWVIIVIIDEWDALFRIAKNCHVVQEEYIKLLRGLFKNSAFTDKTIYWADI